jgi:hypothetical protein
VIQTDRKFSINPLHSITITAEKKKKHVQENQLPKAIAAAAVNLNSSWIPLGEVRTIAALLAQAALATNATDSSRPRLAVVVDTGQSALAKTDQAHPLETLPSEAENH